MNKKNKNKETKDEFHYNTEVNMRSILQNAIKMQAIYRGNRVTIVEASHVTN